MTLELNKIPEWDLGPEHVMQIDLLTELQPNGGYGNIITAIDVFSRDAFENLVSSPTVVNTANVIIDITTRHAELPTVGMTDEGSVFVSNVIHETADTLDITLHNTTTQHAQSFVVSERTHSTTKTLPKTSSIEICKQWHKVLPLAILNFNITCHNSVGCEPSRRIHGQVPYNILEHILGLNLETSRVSTTDYADDFLRRAQVSGDKTKKNIMQSYINNKRTFRKKRIAQCYEKNTTATYWNLNQITKDQKTISWL